MCVCVSSCLMFLQGQVCFFLLHFKSKVTEIHKSFGSPKNKNKKAEKEGSFFPNYNYHKSFPFFPSKELRVVPPIIDLCRVPFTSSVKHASSSYSQEALLHSRLRKGRAESFLIDKEKQDQPHSFGQNYMGRQVHLPCFLTCYYERHFLEP